MNRIQRRLIMTALAIVLCTLCTRPTVAYVERMYSLDEILSEATNICFGQIESVNEETKQIVARIDHDLKGECPYEKIQMNIHTAMPQFVPYMMEKVKPGQSILVFYRIQSRAIACLCYMDNFWFQLYAADQKDHEKMWWRMSHVEIRMNRTWNQSLAELHNVVQKVLAGEMAAPGPDPNVRPFDVQIERARLSGGAASVGRIFRRSVSLPVPEDTAGGVVWIDYDGDGDRDALCCAPEGNRLYRAEGRGVFFEVSEETGLQGGSNSAAWADYNGDDRPDLLLPDLTLYTNTENGFRNDSKRLPKPEPFDAPTCVWIDYDGDGWADVLFPNGERGLTLLRNPGNSDGPFVDVSADAGLGPQGPGAVVGGCISVADIDGDGFSDFLYNAGDGMLFRNTGFGGFEKVESAGLEFDCNGSRPIGVAWGDFDNDGDNDLVVPQPGRTKLFRNNNDGTFSDVTADAGELAEAAGEWTRAVWGDIDRNGRLDLCLTAADGRTRIFLNQPNGTFEDHTQPLGLEAFAGRGLTGAALCDHDSDGDLDLLASVPGGRCAVLLNDFGAGGSGNFLLVRPKSGKGTIGATVRLFDEEDKIVGLRELGVAQGAGGQSDAAAFFGLPGEGKFKITVCMSDGAFAEREIEVDGEGRNIVVAAE